MCGGIIIIIIYNDDSGLKGDSWVAVHGQCQGKVFVQLLYFVIIIDYINIYTSIHSVSRELLGDGTEVPTT